MGADKLQQQFFTIRLLLFYYSFILYGKLQTSLLRVSAYTLGTEEWYCIISFNLRLFFLHNLINPATQKFEKNNQKMIF